MQRKNPVNCLKQNFQDFRISRPEFGIKIARQGLYINRKYFPPIHERRRCSTPDGVVREKRPFSIDMDALRATNSRPGAGLSDLRNPGNPLILKIPVQTKEDNEHICLQNPGNPLILKILLQTKKDNEHIRLQNPGNPLILKIPVQTKKDNEHIRLQNPGNPLILKILLKILLQTKEEFFPKRDSPKGFIFITAGRDLRKTVTSQSLPERQDLKAQSCLAGSFICAQIPQVNDLRLRKSGFSSRVCPKSPSHRHCERSEAIQNTVNHWIASGCALAMTGLDPFETPPNPDRANADRWCPKTSFPPDFPNKTTSVAQKSHIQLPHYLIWRYEKRLVEIMMEAQKRNEEIRITVNTNYK
jgi:hypothetical protein